MRKHRLLALIMALFPLMMAAQSHVVRGVVTDDEGPLIGASVMIKGTSTGTATDVDGNYSITVPSANAVLEFSCLGYRAEERPVGKSTTINIRLNVDDNLLEDVVVVGYGTQAKSHLTGSISKLEGDAAQALQLVAGVGIVYVFKNDDRFQRCSSTLLFAKDPIPSSIVRSPRRGGPGRFR